MNRLQKKCFFAASGLHLLLLVILIVGPAFLSARDQADDVQMIEFLPMIVTDKPFAGGGTPQVAPTQPAPPQPAPPQPQVQSTPPSPPPEPQKVTPPPEPPKKDPDAIEPAKEPKRKPEVSLKQVTRKEVKNTPKKSTTTSDAEAKAEAARARAFKVAASRLRDGLSSSTTVEMAGPGGGGPSYANYASVVKKIYFDAWIEPNADAGTGTAAVTIARDGTVLSARVTRSSGNAAVDRSVQDTLDRVKFIARFPESWKEEQKIYYISFNLEAKKSLG